LPHKLAHFLIPANKMPAALNGISFWQDFKEATAQTHNRNTLDQHCGVIIKTFTP
jgi:hypothetical protein